MFPLFVLVLLLKLIAFLKQREETPCSNRDQLAPMKTNQKDLLRSLRLIPMMAKMVLMRKTCRRFGRVPNTTYMKKIH